MALTVASPGLLAATAVPTAELTAAGVKDLIKEMSAATIGIMNNCAQGERYLSWVLFVKLREPNTPPRETDKRWMQEILPLICGGHFPALGGNGCTEVPQSFIDFKNLMLFFYDKLKLKDDEMPVLMLVPVATLGALRTAFKKTKDAREQAVGLLLAVVASLARLSKQEGATAKAKEFATAYANAGYSIGSDHPFTPAQIAIRQVYGLPVLSQRLQLHQGPGDKEDKEDEEDEEDKEDKDLSLSLSSKWKGG